MSEKLISELTVRLSETLKHDLNDEAALHDRTLSETIRMILEQHLYGAKVRTDAACGRAGSCPTLRGPSGD